MRKAKILLFTACVIGLTAGTRVAWHRLEARYSVPPPPLQLPSEGDSEESVLLLMGEPWERNLDGRVWLYRDPENGRLDPVLDNRKTAVYWRDGKVRLVSGYK